MRKCRLLFLVIVLSLFTAASQAQLPIEAVQRTKQATAFVTVELADGVAEGSAFCIDASGLFVTNAHVVEDQKPGGRLTLILHSGEGDQVVLPDNVVIDNSEYRPHNVAAQNRRRTCSRTVGCFAERR
jgi:S1-C subfamily serine protease